MLFKIVNTDNFGGDYPNESFLNLPAMHEAKAEAIAKVINATLNPHGHYPRWYVVKPEDYVLQPGFEP